MVESLALISYVASFATGLRRLEEVVVTLLSQQQTGKAFIAWRQRARRDALLRQQLRMVVYHMLMGRLAGAFASWRSMASQLAHERYLVHISIARLQQRVKIPSMSL